jgi:hypothetical protein
MNVRLNYRTDRLHVRYLTDIMVEIKNERKMNMKKLFAAGMMLLIAGLYYIAGMGV